LLMEHVPGQPLRTLVKHKCAGVREMTGCAAALLKLHSSPLVFGTPFTVERHLAVRCAGLHEALAEAFPSQADHVRWIVETARTLEARSGAVPTLSHGDFHLGQLQVHERGVWILDLDPLHVGDPAYDIAMVFVMLKHLEHRTDDAGYVRTLLNAFVAGYFSDGTYKRAAQVPMQMALIQLKRACKRFRWQDQAGWPDAVARQIADSVSCMNVAMQLPGVPQSIDEIAGIYDRCPASI
jgi:aminoglycoside phosphotransferase (APT) family kinase protein